MADIKRIYSLLLHSNGLKIRDISKELELDKHYVAELLFSPQYISYWYQDDDSLWFAKEGALQIEEPEEEADELIVPVEIPQKINVNRFLEEDLSDSLRFYLSQVSKYRIYSNNEMIELFKRYRSGDQKAFDMIIKSQQRLVANIALLYCRKGAPLEDIIQEGNVGLIKAAERFDYTFFRSFSNYAKGWILQQISMFMASFPYTVKLPLNQLLLYRKVRKCKDVFEQKWGFEPSINDIAIDKYVTPEKLEYLINLPYVLQHLTMSIDDWDSFPHEGQFTDEVLMKESCQYFVNCLLNNLEQRESSILKSYFGINAKEESLTVIGEHFGLTHERVRQIVVKSISKLRKRLNENSVEDETEDNLSIDEQQPNSRRNIKEFIGRKVQGLNEIRNNTSSSFLETNLSKLGELTIRKTPNGNAIYNECKNCVYWTQDNIIIKNGDFYRVSYRTAEMIITLLLKRLSGLKTGPDIIQARSNSDLYRVFNHKRNAERIESIKINSSTNEYKVMVGGKWFDNKGYFINEPIAENIVTKKSRDLEMKKLSDTPDTLIIRRRNAICKAFEYHRKTVTVSELSRTISRTAWGGVIRECDVEELLKSMVEIVCVEGKYSLRTQL